MKNNKILKGLMAAAALSMFIFFGGFIICWYLYISFFNMFICTFPFLFFSVGAYTCLIFYDKLKGIDKKNINVYHNKEVFFNMEAKELKYASKMVG